MRVTNGMIINTSLNGLYNNMNAMNKTYAQMTTGKKIQTVSDDPIIAGRALKLKTTVLENTQYQSNVKEANSWMEITEAALDNMTELLKTIRTKCVQGSTGTLEKKDKESIKTEIAQLWKQLQDEANVTYGGRYIFSGFKTKDPLILANSYEIKDKNLKAEGDIIVGSDTTLADGSTLEAGSHISSGSILGTGTEAEGGFTLGAGTVLSKEDAKEFLGITLEDGKYFFDSPKNLKEGSELTKEQFDELKASVSPDIDTKVSEVNGKFILTTDVEVGTDKTQGLSNNVAKQLFGVEGSVDTYTTTVKHNANGYEFKGEVIIGAGSTFSGKIISHGETELKENSVMKKDSELAIGTKLGKGTLNPNVVGNIDGHAMEYEIGVNSTITVNTEGMDSIFVEMAQCFNEMFLKIDEALNDDTITTTDLHDMFTKKLDQIDEIMASVSEVTSDLGSRMSRVEYVESRLTDQKLTFKNLLSETEDVDIEEVYTNFNVQYATYQSALQATAKIITNTLADYL